MPVNAQFSPPPKASLAKAAQQLSQAWFPVNPQVVELVQFRLNENYYDERRELLMEDLRSDCSLYLYCLRELVTNLKENGQVGTRGVSHQEFAAIIKDASLEQIKIALNVPTSRVSIHSLENTSRLQAERLEESFLSASAAELLAEKAGLDGQVGYNAALLRQLGLTLIAWNYPNMYRQALDAVQEGRDELNLQLDSAIHSTIGFSPGMLGVKIAQLWGLSENMAGVIGASGQLETGSRNGTHTPVEPSSEDKSRLLVKLCAVGEAFARASNPDRYPSARTDWQSAERVIKQHLGADGVRAIQAKALQLREQYVTQLPRLFRLSDFETEKADDGADQDSTSSYEANVFLKACDRSVRDKFWTIYSQLGSTVSDQLLREFTHRLMPALGFDISCYFVVDPGAGVIAPVLKVGNPSFVRSKPVGLMDSNGALNPVRVALHRRTPIAGQGIVGNEQKPFFVGSIGTDRGVGVIYVELSSRAPEAVKRNPGMVFEALRQCLNDLLMLQG